MIHLQPLPGSSSPAKQFETTVEQAISEAHIYERTGFAAIMIENMHDRPYLLGHVEAETVAAMSVVAQEVRRTVKIPLGVQVLAGANREALAIAHVTRAAFVRVEGFVFAHVADEGLIQSCAGELLRYRRALAAEQIAIFADIKKKHSSHAITADIDLAATARAAKFFLADGLVVTGKETGDPPNPEDLGEVLNASDLPVLIGSGITASNISSYTSADGFIVGSSLKTNGDWFASLDENRCTNLVRACSKIH